MSRSKNEVSYAIERWIWESPPYRWRHVSTHETAEEATRVARGLLAAQGGKLRVVRWTMALMREFP